MNGQTDSLKTYRIRLGHVEALVQARDVVEAIFKGRRKLGAEMPRLYDLIRTLDSSRFEIDRAA